MGERDCSRKGKVFFMGNPGIGERGIAYFWPGEDSKEFENIFKSKSKDLGEFLLERARVLLKEFDVKELDIRS